MRPLLPPDLELADEGGLFRAYAPPRRNWVRANFISSADGAASLDGRAGGLGTPLDQELLATMRAHADVVVVGAGTVRAEGYGPLRHSEARHALRREHGLEGSARLAVVSRSLRFTGRERWIAEAPVPPLILTGEAAARDIPGAETVACGAQLAEAGRMIEALHQRGLFGVLCEGGPTVFAEFAGAGLLDELCLTISPTLAGPGAARIVDGAAWAVAPRGRLTQLIEDDGLLFTRYEFSG